MLRLSTESAADLARPRRESGGATKTVLVRTDIHAEFVDPRASQALAGQATFRPVPPAGPGAGCRP